MIGGTSVRFVDRDRELGLIRRALSGPYCFVVVTGRRRIGKTRLVREALDGVDHVGLFIPRKRLTLVLEDMRRSVEEQTGFSPSFGSLGELFEYLFRVVRKPVFIDEVSNLDFADGGAFSDLQRLYDGGKEAGIHLVVAGSYVGVMERVFTWRKEPLFGRATDLVHIGPLPARHSIEMCRDAGFTFVDALEACSLLGGVPRYLELLARYGGFDDLASDMFAPGSIFLDEGENVLIQEFGAAWDTYFSILEVIAEGRHGPSAIASRLGMPVGMVPKYLQALTRLRIVERRRPVLGKERHVRYGISDPFFQVWFDVCHPRIGALRDGTATVERDRISTAVGRGMERVMREVLSGEGQMPFAADEVGGWWDRSGHEIDIVACSARERAILVGEVKWTGKAAGFDDVRGLLDDLGRVDWHNASRTEYAFLVSKNGFTRAAERLMSARNVVGLGPRDIEAMVLGRSKVRWKGLTPG